MQKGQNLMPQLRFSVFESGKDKSKYNKYNFKDIFIFSTGKNIKQSEASREFEIPCIRYGELYHMYNEVIYEVINKTNLNKSDLLFSEGNEILLPSAGEDPLDIGSASSLTFKNIAIGRTINILRPKIENVYCQNYVAYYISNKLRRKISTLAKGSSISNVYNSDLKELEIILPNLLEQKKVANFISTIDKQILTLKKKKTFLEQYKKGVLEKIFKQELRFKDEDGNEYSKWKKINLDRLIKEVNNRTKSNNEYPVLSSTKTGVYLQEDYFKKQAASSDTTNYKIAEKGSFTYRSMSDTGLFTFNIQNIINKGLVSPAYPVFNSTELIEDKFLHLSLNFSPFFKRQLLSMMVGGTRLALSFSKLMKISIYIPNLEEQIKIANFLSAIDKNIALVNTKIEQTKSYKKGLMQQMFV